MNTVRGFSYVFLCILPFLCLVVVGVRVFRVPGVYQTAGVVYFFAIAIAGWILIAGAIKPDGQDGRCFAWRERFLSHHFRSSRASLGRSGWNLAGKRGRE
jgi:hypothetical protein